jgi:hypothetical protein
MPVGTGAVVFSEARTSRLRFTITRSSDTETRYWSRSRPDSRGVVIEKLPLAEKWYVLLAGPQTATNPGGEFGVRLAGSISTEHSRSPARGDQRVGNA